MPPKPPRFSSLSDENKVETIMRLIKELNGEDLGLLCKCLASAYRAPLVDAMNQGLHQHTRCIHCGCEFSVHNTHNEKDHFCPNCGNPSNE